jgi:hypothetical protein
MENMPAIGKPKQKEGKTSLLEISKLVNQQAGKLVYPQTNKLAKKFTTKLAYYKQAN